MKIAEGIEMLEISVNLMGSASKIHPTLIWDDEHVILVDTGFPGQLSPIKEAIENVGIPFNNLNMIILTHQDIDHIGNLASIKKELSNNIEVLASEEEKPYIEGVKSPIKLTQLEERLDSLPEEMKAMYGKMKLGFQHSFAKVDRIVTDGEDLPCGIKVIATPGHTPGHISLYHQSSKTLITGDLLNIENGILEKSRPSINYDNDLVIKSIQKLTQYDIDSVICFHGGLFNTNVKKRIRELSESK